MEAVEVGILRASSRRQLKLRIADSLTVSSRLKLGADVTREAVQGRVNCERRLSWLVVIGRVAPQSDERPSTPLEPTPRAKFLGTKTHAHARAVGRRPSTPRARTLGTKTYAQTHTTLPRQWSEFTSVRRPQRTRMIDTHTHTNTRCSQLAFCIAKRRPQRFDFRAQPRG